MAQEFGMISYCHMPDTTMTKEVELLVTPQRQVSFVNLLYLAFMITLHVKR